MPPEAHDVDLKEALADEMPILPLPDELDSLQQTAEKLASYANVVKSGKSLAVHTGFKATPHSERDPVKLALEAMSAMERDEYVAWSERGILSDFDWEKNKEAIPTGKDSAKRYAQRAAAMNTAWRTDAAEPEHAAWLTNHRPEYLGLLKALVRIETAKASLRGGVPGQDVAELAEYQTINKIRSLAVQAEQKQMKVIRQLEADILQDLRVLKERVDSLELKKPGGDPKQQEVRQEVKVEDEDLEMS